MKLDLQVRLRRPAGFVLDAAVTSDTDALAVVGPSGSGKSTLLDAVAGLEPISGPEPVARLHLDGEEIGQLPAHRRGVGYVTQDPHLFPHLSVRANLLFSPRATGLDEIPEALGLAPLLERMPRNLSGGEKRRVALGRALLSRPRLLLLDEPFSGLDESARREAMSLLRAVRDRFRVPMILVSHVPEEVIGLCDVALRLEAGRVAAFGPSWSVLRGDETRIDNFLTGTVIGPGRVRVDGVDLFAPVPAGLTGEVRLACYAHDILLARSTPDGISARNCFTARVASLVPLGHLMLAELRPVGLRALLTRDSAQSLGLEPGAPVTAIIKATSLVCVGGG